MKRCVNCGRVVDDAVKECPVCHSINFEQQMNIKNETIDFKSVKSRDTKPSVSGNKKNQYPLIDAIDALMDIIYRIKG